MKEIHEAHFKTLAQVLTQGAYQQAVNDAKSGNKQDFFDPELVCEAGARLAGSPVAAPLFPAIIKIYESRKLKKAEAIKALYSAINYLASAILLYESLPENVLARCTMKTLESWNPKLDPPRSDEGGGFSELELGDPTLLAPEVPSVPMRKSKKV